MSVYIILLPSCINGNTDNIQRILYYYNYTDVVLLQTRLHCLFSANLPLVYFIQDEKNQILATNIWLNMVSDATVPCTFTLVMCSYLFNVRLFLLANRTKRTKS